jgi:hypothetical protein
MAYDASIEARSRKLHHRLESRPYDVNAVVELIDIAYNTHNYDSCITSILRSFEMKLDTSAKLRLMLGRCYYRRFLKLGSPKGNYKRKILKWVFNHVIFVDVKLAIGAYKHVIKNVDYQRKIVHYFELATMQLRLGQHQVIRQN